MLRLGNLMHSAPILGQRISDDNFGTAIKTHASLTLYLYPQGHNKQLTLSLLSY